MNKRVIYLILFSLLSADLVFSFFQHLAQPLDGDMASGIVPAEDVKKVFADPFGLSVVLDHQQYPNTNRFFSEYSLYAWNQNIPHALQSVSAPVDSVYLSAALFKILLQIGLIYILASFASGKKKLNDPDLLIAAVLIAPLFQINGYRSYMGIIDPANTYCFFYALPLLALLIFYRSFFENDKKPGILKIALLIGLMLFNCFSGPLNPGIILIVATLYKINMLITGMKENPDKSFLRAYLHKIKSSKKSEFVLIMLAAVISLYSLFIGTFNSVYSGASISITERYARLPEGIGLILTQKPGFIVLLLMLTIGLILIAKKYKTPAGLKILNWAKWFGLFALLYIFLLPLGGYKEYRSNILRYDTFMPITAGLMILVAMTAVFIIKQQQRKVLSFYIPGLAIFCLIFTLADKGEFDKNACERSALKKISESNEPVVLLNTNCEVLNWDIIHDEKSSELNGVLLYQWGITKKPVLYKQQ